MRKLIFIITTLLFAGILSASAQWSSSGNDMSIAGSSNTNVEKRTIGFYNIGGSVSFINLSGNYFDSSKKGNTAGTINLARLGFFLGRKSNVYLGFGWDLPFKGWTERAEINGKVFSTSYTTVGYRFPVYAGYRLPITESFKLYAHTGITFDFDFAGYWGSMTYDGETEKIDTKEIEQFNKQFNVFNSSWMLSAGLMFKHVYLGIDYFLPFTDVFNHKHVAESVKGKIGSFNICIGITFDIKSAT